MNRYLDDGSAVVSLSGEIDAAAAASLEEHVRDALDHGALAVQLDMGAVTYLDTVAVAALIRARNRCLAAGVPLSVRAPSRPVARILALTGLSTAFGPVDPVGPEEEPPPA